MTVRDKLIAAGVRNLQEFGYPKCDAKNILTDYVYKKFFLSMLKENRGQISAEADKAIDVLVEELK